MLAPIRATIALPSPSAERDTAARSFPVTGNRSRLQLPAAEPSPRPPPARPAERPRHSSGARSVVDGADGGALTYAWGLNDRGQCGVGRRHRRVPEPACVAVPGVVALAAGGAAAYAVDDEGRTFAWGAPTPDGSGLEAQLLPTLQTSLARVHVRAVAAGDTHAAFVAADGALLLWAQGFDAPTPARHLAEECFYAVSCGVAHGVAVATSGRAYSWGQRRHAALGRASSSSTRPAAVEGVPFVAQAACGDFHTLVLTPGGEVWACGDASDGQLGLAGGLDDGAALARVAIDDGVSVSAVAAGGGSSMAISQQRELFAWGRNSAGQLGLGHCRAVFQPTLVAWLADENVRAAQVDLGDEHAVLVSETGNVYTWGRRGVLGFADDNIDDEESSGPRVIESFATDNKPMNAASASGRLTLVASVTGSSAMLVSAVDPAACRVHGPGLLLGWNPDAGEAQPTAGRLRGGDWLPFVVEPRDEHGRLVVSGGHSVEVAVTERGEARAARRADGVFDCAIRVTGHVGDVDVTVDLTTLRVSRHGVSRARRHTLLRRRLELVAGPACAEQCRVEGPRPDPMWAGEPGRATLVAVAADGVPKTLHDDDVAATLEPGGLRVRVSAGDPGCYALAFSPEQAGEYELRASVGGERLTAPPLRVVVRPGAACAERSSVGLVGAGLRIALRDRFGNPTTTTAAAGALAARSASVGVTVHDNLDGTLVATLAPDAPPGEHRVVVALGDVEVQGSPAVVSVAPPRRSKVGRGAVMMSDF